MDRKVSWGLAALAYATLAVMLLAIEADYQKQMAAYGGFVKCGYNAAMTNLLGLSTFGPLSLLATRASVPAFLQCSPPRPKLRILEIAAISFPAAWALFMIASLFL
jgi:hypothetical protein